MRYLKVPICFILIIMLSACSKSQFMDLSGFIYNYNKVSDEETDFTDFYIAKGENRQFRLSRYPVLLTLKEASDGKIQQCRVMMTKITENGEQSKNISTDSKNFLSILKNTLQAFCSYDEYTAEALIGEFGLGEQSAYLKEGELTKKQGNFYFVYYSTSLMCEMRIYNTYICEIEPTKKPEG